MGRAYRAAAGCGCGVSCVAVSRRVQHICQQHVSAAGRARWDGKSVFDFGGTYGEYLLAKVGRSPFRTSCGYDLR